jgi:hypothetical protein
MSRELPEADAMRADGVEDGIRSQLLVRELNEQIHTLDNDAELDLELVCECVRGGCFERLTIPLEVYEMVRRFPTRFIVKPGHEDETERIAGEDDGYLVVEKIGVDAESAILFDPRRRTAPREKVG